MGGEPLPVPYAHFEAGTKVMFLDGASQMGALEDVDREVGVGTVYWGTSDGKRNVSRHRLENLTPC